MNSYEKQLDQPMPPYHSQRQSVPGVGQLDAVIRLVVGQPSFAERLKHACDRSRRNGQCFGNVTRRRRLLSRLANLVDRFGVVFDRQAWQTNTL